MNKSKEEINLFYVYIWSLSFLKPYFFRVILLIICGLVISASELLIPKLFQYFIDVILLENNMTMFSIGLYIFIGILMLKLVASSVQELLQRYVQENAIRDVQWIIIKKLRLLGVPYIEKNSTGQILSLLNTEVQALQNLYRKYFPEMIQKTIYVIVAFYFMMNISIILCLMIVSCFLLYYLIGPFFEKRASLIAKKLAESQIKMGQKFYESASAIKEIIEFNAQKWDLTRALNNTKTYNKLYSKRYWYAYCRGAIRRFTFYIGTIGLFVYGFYGLQNNSISAGEFVAFLLIYFSTMFKLTSIITLLTEQKLLMFQAEKLYSYLKTSLKVKEPENLVELKEIKGQITFSNVSFSFLPGQQVLQNINLNIPPGQKVAFIGKSGSGKSTILKLISRFYDPDSGQIFLDDVNLQRVSLTKLRDSIGFVFQDVFLFGASIRENIKFGNPKASEKEVIEAAKAACIHDFVTSLPHGYDTNVGERGISLSGGQKQRINLARVFIKDPPIIILDEPTSALDNITDINIQNSINKYFKDKTVITVAHRLSTIRHYDHIYVLDQGEIKESGSNEQLMQQRGIYYEFLASMKEERI